MQCPQCRARLQFSHVGKHRCPRCEARIYFSRDDRWLRGISCGVVSIAVNYRWYPLEGGCELHLLWYATAFVVLLAFLLVSFFLLPPNIELTSDSGSIRLNLKKKRERVTDRSLEEYPPTCSRFADT